MKGIKKKASIGKQYLYNLGVGNDFSNRTENTEGRTQVRLY